VLQQSFDFAQDGECSRTITPGKGFFCKQGVAFSKQRAEPSVPARQLPTSTPDGSLTIL